MPGSRTRVRREISIWVLSGLLLVSCGTGEASGDGSTGIRGLALVGPMCPVLIAGSPCPDAPFSGTIEARDDDGNVVASAPTDDDGSFRLELAPGSYVVHAVTPGGGGPPWAEAQRVRVEPGGFTEITIRLDSGIR